MCAESTHVPTPRREAEERLAFGPMTCFAGCLGCAVPNIVGLVVAVMSSFRLWPAPSLACVLAAVAAFFAIRKSASEKTKHFARFVIPGCALGAFLWWIFVTSFSIPPLIA